MQRISAQRRVLFVHNDPRTFVLTDQALLSEVCVVRDWYVRSKTIDIPATLKAVASADIVFCWFASWHSFLPVLFANLLHKPSIVVIGGYDTASLPEANYGSQRQPLPRLISRTIIHTADRLIANSQSARREAMSNAGANPARLEVIYHGFVETHPTIAYDRHPSALNVGGVWQENLLRKGLLSFVQAAKVLPDVAFVHAGNWYDNSISTLCNAAAPNVRFMGFVSQGELHDLYGKSATYVQPSLHEGFGMTVAESMLGGCIPVVTRLGSLPEVVGDAGVYCASNTPQDVASAIQQALLCGHDARQRAKDYILTTFPMERRRAALHQIIDQVAKRP